MNKFFTREAIQETLEMNEVHSKVSYLEREVDGSPDNWIVYSRSNPNNKLRSDNTIHIRKIELDVIHFHKKKLDSIEDLMFEHFGVEPMGYNVKQLDTDYWGTYYSFEIFTKGRW